MFTNLWDYPELLDLTWLQLSCGWDIEVSQRAIDVQHQHRTLPHKVLQLTITQCLYALTWWGFWHDISCTKHSFRLHTCNLLMYALLVPPNSLNHLMHKRPQSPSHENSSIELCMMPQCIECTLFHKDTFKREFWRHEQVRNTSEMRKWNSLGYIISMMVCNGVPMDVNVVDQ